MCVLTPHDKILSTLFSCPHPLAGSRLGDGVADCGSPDGCVGAPLRSAVRAVLALQIPRVWEVCPDGVEVFGWTDGKVWLPSVLWVCEGIYVRLEVLRAFEGSLDLYNRTVSVSKAIYTFPRH